MISFRHGGIGLALACAVLYFCPPAIGQSAAPPVQQSRAPVAQAFTPAPLDSGFGLLDISRPKGISPHKIVARFAAKESQFKRALDNYTYRRTVKVDTFDDQGNVDGQYVQTDDITFSPSAAKFEKVVYAPENTLKRISMSPADFDDIEHRLPFTLTTEDIGRYHVTYVGKQWIDEINTYVFDVEPKQIEQGRRYFTGRIWVDAKDFQIVVTNGKNIPDNTKPGQEDLSVPFTTYRQQIDGKYWFPVYTKAEGVLHFKNCKECLPEDIPLKEIVKYQNYKRFGSDVRILYKSLALSSEPAASSQQAPADASQVTTPHAPDAPLKPRTPMKE